MADSGIQMNHSKRERLTAQVLVAVQLSLIAAIVLIPRRPSWAPMPVVTAIAWAIIGGAAALGIWGAIHLGDGLTPLPLPNGSVDLVTSGPYRWVRHPIYAAVVMGGIGFALHSRTIITLATAGVLAVFLALKARWEEGHLRSTFPGYDEYASRVGRFIPGVGRVR